MPRPRLGSSADLNFSLSGVCHPQCGANAIELIRLVLNLEAHVPVHKRGSPPEARAGAECMAHDAIVSSDADVRHREAGAFIHHPHFKRRSVGGRLDEKDAQRQQPESVRHDRDGRPRDNRGARSGHSVAASDRA